MTDPAHIPALGESPSGAFAAGQELPLLIPHSQMAAELDQGTAALLSGEIAGIVQHAGTWWVQYERGWLRITDEHVLADLNQVADRLATARVHRYLAPREDRSCPPPQP